MKSSRSDRAARRAPLPPDVAEALASVAPRLGPIASRVRYVSSVPSTNDLAARLAEQGADEGTVVLTDEQTAGRGRHGRAWFSPPGAGLYASMVLRPPASALPLLTMTTGVAVAEGVRSATGLTTELKWPNDLMVGRRKLGGVLAEASTIGGEQPYVVVGVGLNLRVAAYPPEVVNRATSLEAELGRPIDRGVVLAEALAAWAARYAELAAGRFGAILSAWRAFSPSSHGAAVEWDGPDGPRRGTTHGIDETGALLVRIGTGVERVTAGEVRWI